MDMSWQFAFMSPSNTASVALQSVLNILDVTQLGKTHNNNWQPNGGLKPILAAGYQMAVGSGCRVC